MRRCVIYVSSALIVFPLIGKSKIPTARSGSRLLRGGDFAFYYFPLWVPVKFGQGSVVIFPPPH